MDPPPSVLHTHLLRAEFVIEAKVDKMGTVLCLDMAWRGGVEAGPGVEDDRTPGVVMVLLIFGSVQAFQQPKGKVIMCIKYTEYIFSSQSFYLNSFIK